MLIYRYIFVFLDLAMKMEDAQNMRMGYISFKNWMHSLAILQAHYLYGLGIKGKALHCHEFKML